MKTAINKDCGMVIMQGPIVKDKQTERSSFNHGRTISYSIKLFYMKAVCRDK